jgi:hypothetical protein
MWTERVQVSLLITRRIFTFMVHLITVRSARICGTISQMYEICLSQAGQSFLWLVDKYVHRASLAKNRFPNQVPHIKETKRPCRYNHGCCPIIEFDEMTKCWCQILTLNISNAMHIICNGISWYSFLQYLAPGMNILV